MHSTQAQHRVNGGKKNSLMANRTQPKQFDPSKFHKDCIDIFRANQWLTFLEKFNGQIELTTREFASSFTGERAVVGNLSFRVSEDTIAQAIGINPEGENYFKTKQFNEKLGHISYQDQEYHNLNGRQESPGVG